MSKQLTLDQYGYQKRKVDSPKKKSKRTVKEEPAGDADSQPQSELQDDNLKILRNFDLDPAYGPAIGMSRLDRWRRAQEFGLNPDPTIRDLILQHASVEEYTNSIWKKTLAS